MQLGSQAAATIQPVPVQDQMGRATVIRSAILLVTAVMILVISVMLKVSGYNLVVYKLEYPMHIYCTHRSCRRFLLTIPSTGKHSWSYNYFSATK